VRDLDHLSGDLQQLGRENLTKRARVQEGPLQPLVGEVNRLAGRVEHVLRQQKQMLEAVSHELRTPVARLQFRVEELRDLPGTDKNLDAMEDDLSELNALLSELMTYLRVDVMDATCSDVDVDVMAERLVRRQRTLFPTVKGEVVGEATWSIPRKALSRAVDNLIRNALRHARTQVVVTVDDVRITVEDDGPGVALVDRERIFEPFETVNRSRGTDTGIGLGLPIVSRIAQKLGARVWVDDSPLGGARFVFERRQMSDRFKG
jgi:signal transduction histidine kinase